MVKLPGLRRQRVLAALTQEELARKAGVQRPTVTRLECGSNATIGTIKKLCAALACTPADLIEFSKNY